MVKWTSEYLEGMEGRHIYSERDCRIQVSQVRATAVAPWQIPNGSLLVIVLRGSCILVCDNAETALECGCQAILGKGESFGLRVESERDPALVQFVWMPGISGT